MRVLHLSTATTWGGGERQVLWLLRGLGRRGVEQALVTRRGAQLAERARAEGFVVQERALRGGMDPLAAFALARTLVRERFDVLHMHTAHAHGTGRLAAALLGRGRRSRMVVSRRVEHSIYRHSFLGLNRWKYARGVDCILCISERVKEVLRRDGLPEGLLEVVRSGVDLEALVLAAAGAERLREEVGVPDDAFLVGTAGSLVEVKGHRHLLEAFALLRERLPRAALLLLGEGPLRADLEARARALGVADAVRMPGFRSDAPRWIRALDCFAFSSLSEGLGTGVLDAMALGRPVVATTAGGIPEMVEDEVTGLLVPPADPQALAGAILRVAAEPAAARRRAAAAQVRVARDFSVERMVERTHKAYRRLLGEERS